MPFRLELTIGTTCASSYGCFRVLRFWIHLCVELWLFSFSPLLGPLVRRAMIVFVFSVFGCFRFLGSQLGHSKSVVQNRGRSSGFSKVLKQLHTLM